jgi:hypothetical protein
LVRSAIWASNAPRVSTDAAVMFAVSFFMVFAPGWFAYIATCYGMNRRLV